MKAQEYLKSEKAHYGSIFVDINYAIDNITPLVENKNLSDRKYVSRLPVLKRYIELIEAAEAEEQTGGFFKVFQKDKYKELLEKYKRDNRVEFEQLSNCRECACLNCIAECKFDGCLGCRDGARVEKCDHKAMSLIFHKNYTLELTNERTGRSEKYIVLATAQNIERNKRYIIIEGMNTKEKFVLYYYPGLSEDTYGEIMDEHEFDQIVSAYESIER